MECTTIERYDTNGSPVLRAKRQFETLDEAIAAAKKVNSNDKIIHKVVAYKCTSCFKYHVGRNGKVLSEKDRDKCKKHQNEQWDNFKRKLKFE
jgi:hypothetical protein